MDEPVHAALDAPICSAKEDRLDRVLFAQLIVKALLEPNEKGATVAGLVGTWGTGKSSVANLVIQIVGERANLQFVSHALQQQASSMISMAVGGAQPNFSQGLIRSLQIALPPQEVQEEFAEKVSSALKSKEAQQLALNELDALFVSLQATSFSGSKSS